MPAPYLEKPAPSPNLEVLTRRSMLDEQSARYALTGLKYVAGAFCSRVESTWETITPGWRALCHVTGFGHPL